MRRYLPTFAELVDRLSILILKSIFIPENKTEYDAEQALILHDLDEILNEKSSVVSYEDDGTTSQITHEQIVNSTIIRAILILMLTNRYIWENEAKARLGGNEQDKLLKLTHSINGIRNAAKNVIAHELRERKDLKVDTLAAELLAEFGNWNLFKKEE